MRSIREACKVAGTVSETAGTADTDACPRSAPASITALVNSSTKSGTPSVPSTISSLGQFLDKERHAIRALDDLVDDIGRQRSEIAGKLVHQGCPFAAAEAVQRDHRHLGLAGPGRLELRPVGVDRAG
jgi:hypothetical protein